LKIAAVQMCSTADVADNLRRACAYVDQAAKAGAALVVLPEFFNTIYFAQYWDKGQHALAEAESGPTLTAIRDAAARNGIDVLATIYEMIEPGLYFDTAFHVTQGGEILHRYRKVHPAAVNSLEKLYFRYGTALGTYQFAEFRVGIGICYDMSFPETARCLAVNGAELIIAPYATSRTAMFQELLRTRAFENGCFLLAANKVGVEDAWTFGGGSLIAGPRGEVLASANTSDEALIVADIDRDAVIEARIAFPNRRDRRPELYGALTAPVHP
jgi:predicted amidohydrolase